MLGKSFSLLFFLKRPKNYTGGKMPVYLRITTDGNAKEWCTSRKCDSKIWNQAAGIAMGKKEEIKELIRILKSLN